MNKNKLFGEPLDLKRKARTLGLSLSMLFAASACTTTTGNGFVADQDKCVPYDSVVHLGLGQKINLGGRDISTKDGDVFDSLVIKNPDGRSLHLVGTNDAKIDFADSHAIQLPDTDGLGQYDISVQADSLESAPRFRYLENKHPIIISAAKAADQIIQLSLIQDCK